MTDLWWYCTDDEQVGPVDSNTVRRLYARGTLDNDSQVRLGPRGTWQSLGQVDQFCAIESQPTPTQHQSAAIAIRPEASSLSSAIQQANWHSLQKEGRQQSDPQASSSPASAKFSRWLESMQGSLVVLGEWCTDLLMTVIGDARVRWVLAVVTVVLCGLGITAVDVTDIWWTEAGLITELQEMHQAVQRQRSFEMTQQEWDQFARTQAERATAISQLVAPSADATQPIRLEILRAARDALPPILQDQQGTSPDVDERFARHLQLADQFHGANTTAFAATDGLTILIVAGDAMILVIAGLWFFRRK